MCEMALLEEDLPLRKGNLEVMVATRRRIDIEMEDWDVEDVEDGEYIRLGVSLISRF
jgi:hypothetical protein